MKIVIIGGVAAGTKAAAKLKRENPNDEIVIYTKGKDISYAGCGLPYYIGGAIETERELIVNTPAKFMGLTGTTVYTQSEAVAVDPAAKTISVRYSGMEASTAAQQGKDAESHNATGEQKQETVSGANRLHGDSTATDSIGEQGQETGSNATEEQEHPTETVRYDKLIIAVGAEPSVPPVEGTKLPGVFTVQIGRAHV